MEIFLRARLCLYETSFLTEYLHRLCISAEDARVLEPCCVFLKSQGRMKFLRPLYKALYKSKMGRCVDMMLYGI